MMMMMMMRGTMRKRESKGVCDGMGLAWLLVEASHAFW